MDAIRAEDRLSAEANGKAAPRISIRRSLPQRLTAEGLQSPPGWQTLSDGSALWTASVESVGAVGLRLHFSDVQLPPEATLLIFAAGKSDPVVDVIGRDAMAGRSDFWSATAFADRVTVECRIPAGGDPATVRFQIDELLHRYFGEAGGAAAASAAGDCHADPSCEPDWQVTAQAVAGLGVVGQQGELFCTACLINDADPAAGTDYALTANHCVGSQAEADDTEFYWFYQTSACNGSVPLLSTLPRTAGGADFIAGSSRILGNDFALLRLRRPTPGGVTYAAWSTERPSPGSPVVGIHHPAGDYRRISFGTAVLDEPEFVRVRWSRGVTEPGSSGSPLFNGAQEIVGQLYGGRSVCEAPGRTDFYGRFSDTFPVIASWLLGKPEVAPNDEFANAWPLTGASGHVFTSSAGTSRSLSHFEPSILENAGGKSLWFRWTAPASGPCSFTTRGSRFDTLLAVFKGTQQAFLELVAASDESKEPPLSAVTFNAVAGTEYRIAVDGYDGAGGTLGIEWHPGDDPAVLLNDQFASAQPLSGARGEIGASNWGATRESLEPAHAGNWGGSSLWFRWTPPSDGFVMFDTEGSQVDTLLAVYTGSTLERLGAPVRSNDDINAADGISTSRVSFLGQKGVTYRIAVDGYADAGFGADRGFILLNWQPTASPLGTAPANDRFDQAQHLAEPQGTLAGSNLRAGKEVLEYEHADAYGGRSVWYRWTAPATGLVTFDTLGSNFDTLLAIYTGTSVTSTRPLGGNDDIDATTRQSRVTVPVEAGQEYRIAVDGFRTPSNVQREGDFTLTWTFEPGGHNDSFADAQRIEGLAGRVAGENWRATVEPAEPEHADSPGGASVWYRWKAPATGEVTFDTLGSTFDTSFAAYIGSSVDSLTAVAINQDTADSADIYTSRLKFLALAGQEYFLAIDGYREATPGASPADTGSIRLSWEQIADVPLELRLPRITANGFTVTARGTPGAAVALLYSSGLDGWREVASGTLNSSGLATLTDPAGGVGPAGFYLVRRR